MQCAIQAGALFVEILWCHQIMFFNSESVPKKHEFFNFQRFCIKNQSIHLHQVTLQKQFYAVNTGPKVVFTHPEGIIMFFANIKENSKLENI